MYVKSMKSLTSLYVLEAKPRFYMAVEAESYSS